MLWVIRSIFSSGYIRARNSLWIYPGKMVFAVMWWNATSRKRQRVNAMIPAFDDKNSLFPRRSLEAINLVCQGEKSHNMLSI